MTLLRSLVLTAALAATPAWAQQPAAKTTEQQARSYILSAFVTGAAPLVLSEDVRVTPALRERLGLPADANSRAVYRALVGLTGGKNLSVRAPTGDEIAKTEAQAQPGKPVFTLESGDAAFVLQYDLERDHVTYVAEPSPPVAMTSPVAPPSPPQQIAEPPKPAPETPVAAPLPPVAATPPPPVAAPSAPVQIVEPREPRMAKPAAAAPMSAPVVQATRALPREEKLRPAGPCVIKPVMSDQDLVNCGATPR